VDPTKAAEPTKPRGSTSSKRPARLSNDDLPVKRSRLDSEASNKNNSFTRDMLDPALFAEMPNASESVEVITRSEALSSDMQNEMRRTSTSAFVKRDPDQYPSPGLTYRPTIELGSGYAVPEHAIDDGPDPARHLTPHASASPVSQRHSSRQPKTVDRFVPEAHRSPSKPRVSSSARRASSAVSGHTIVAIAKSRRSSSNTSTTLHNGGSALLSKDADGSTDANGNDLIQARPGSRGRESTVESELDADEKLARELQAEEHGLRRRQSMRA
jgi:F-box and leucine-rich repeat protein 10/11